jgi:putative inorganic carbon (hco3(-)) transporter
VTASPLELVGMLLACGGAAVALLADDRRLRYLAAGIALIVAPVLVAGDVWQSARFVDLRDHPANLAAAVAVAAIAVGGATAVIHRFRWTLPVAVFALMPLRAPVHLGGQTSHLLIPLYVVIAAGVVCGGYELLAARSASREADRSPRERLTAGFANWPAAIWLHRVLAATLVLYAIQTAYSADVSNAIENACFFLVPFAVMLVLLEEVAWTRELLGRVLIAVAAMGLLFAGVAFAEYAVRDLLLSRGDLLQSNQLHLYFRVNSLFYDPNVLGRYLALDLVALGAYLAWSRQATWAIAAALVSGALLAALAFSYSITSFVALVAGLLVVAALRWSVRWALAGGAAIVVCGAIFLAVSGTGHTDFSSEESFNTAGSGRVSLARGGIDLAGDRPIAGWGSGSFGAAFARHIQRAKTTVSHSEPITVAAEQGAIGLIVYVALLVLALAVLLSGASASAGTAAIAACFVAMVVHSLGYAAFTIDPATWALIGVGLAIRRQPAVSGEAARPAGVDATASAEPRPATV